MQGHTDEVNSVNLKGYLVVSGGNDKIVRLWDWRTGACLAVLEGHEGKVWSVTLDRFRVASGGRHGEARLWNLQDYEKQLVTMTDEEYPDENSNIQSKRENPSEPVKYTDSRALFYHPRSTSIASIHLDRD